MKIAAGFGGTLNSLVSLVFIFAIVIAMALSCHLYFAGQEVQTLSSSVFSEGRFQYWLTVAVFVDLALGAIVPLRIGIRSFQKMEL